MADEGVPRWRVRLALRVGTAANAELNLDLGDVIIEFGTGARVGDLALSVVADLGPSASVHEISWAALLVGGRRIADADEWLVDLPVADGTSLTVLASAAGPDGAAHDGAALAAFHPARCRARRFGLVVSPLSGEPSFESPIVLPAGTSTIGRSPAHNMIVIADPSVSRRHAVLEVGDVVVIDDAGSTNGTLVDGNAITTGHTLAVGSRLTLGDVEFELRVMVDELKEEVESPSCHSADADAKLVARRGRIGINPSPQAVVPLPGPVAVVVPDLPDPPDEQRLPWLSIAIPVVLAVALSVVLLAVGGFDGRYALLSGGFLLMSPIMMAAAFWESRRAGRRRWSRLMKAFEAALADASQRGRAALASEADRREWIHPGPGRLVRRARREEPGLWSGPERFDGQLRVGCAAVASLVGVESAQGAPIGNSGAAVDERIAGQIEQLASLADELGHHVAAPVSVSMDVPLAVVGEPSSADGVMRWLTLQAATILPPGTVEFHVITPSADSQRWDWLKWLPHTVGLSVNSPSSNDLELQASASRVVVIVDAAEVDDAAWVGRIVAAADRAGATVWWTGPLRSAVPAATETVIEIHHDGVTARLDEVGQRTSTSPVAVDMVGEQAAEAWSRALAPLFDASAASGRAEIPQRVSMVDVLDDPDVIDDPDALVAAWARSDGTLRAPLGISGSGVVAVDLRRDGPHAVVAGTTGSGKSELLQTFVAGLALGLAPSRVNFLLVDYKGGSAFGKCAALPHTVGLVTDLDGALVERVLTSLRAELRRREAVLADAGAKDLVAMEALSPFDAPPSLVIVVDEFASLATEVPGFVDGMIDIARRGRSLGLHLVLATQRPAGVVSDHLLANANLRIALRVSDEHQSTDLVGVGDAASIPRSRPGRAVARFGPDDVVVVQTAFCGGRSPMDRRLTDDSAGVRIRRLTLAADSETPGPLGAENNGDDRAPIGGSQPPVDLERLVRTACRAADQIGESHPRRPWLDPLPHRFSLGALSTASHETASDEQRRSEVVVGLVDDPSRQSQSVMYHNLGAGPLVVFGGGPVDPARFVEAVVVGAVVGRSPHEVQVDVIDGEAGALRDLERLPQVGSVIAPDDDARVTRLLRHLRSLVSLRIPDTPARILVVADLLGFIARFEGVDGGEAVAALTRLAADGAAAGVHLVLATPRRLGLPIALATAGRKVVMPMGSDDDAVAMGADPRLLDSSIPGRAVVDGLALQTVVLDAEGPWSLNGVVERETRRLGALRAPEVGVLPDRIEVSALLRGGRHRSRDGGLWAPLLVGVGDHDLGPVHVDLRDGNLLIAGPIRSGRSTALASLAASLCAGPDQAPPRRLLVAPRESDWAMARIWDDVAIGDEAIGLLQRTRIHLDEDAEHPTVIFVDDSTDLDESIDEELAVLATLGRGSSIRLVVAAEAAVARRSYGGLVARLRRERRALLLQPDVDLDGDLAGVRLKRRGAAPAPPGRGELVDRGRVSLVQVAVAEPLLDSAVRRPLFRAS